MTRLTHLQRLEAESIQIIREAVAESERPVMLYSVGKDSSVMLHLAMKAFYPSKPPFPLLHVDTTWKFRAMYEFRDKLVEELGVELLVHQNPDCVDAGINPFDHGSADAHRHVEDRGPQAGARPARLRPGLRRRPPRRGEVPGQGAGVLHPLGPAPLGPQTTAARAVAPLQRPQATRARASGCSRCRTGPSSTCGSTSTSRRSRSCRCTTPPPVRSSSATARSSWSTTTGCRLDPGEVPKIRSVRFRTLGCYPLTGAVESTATTLTAIIQEMLLTTTSERQGRVIDHDSSGSMEKKKQEGYF